MMMSHKCFKALANQFPKRGGLPPRKHLSSYSFSRKNGFDEEQWPVVATNTLLNICPQGEKMVIERLGKYERVQDPGWFLAIPLIDRIAYIVDTRETAVKIPPQNAITRDNVSVEVSGNLYTQFQDPAKAAYGSANPLYSIKQHAQSSMRAAIGELELDEILHARAKLNKLISSSIQDACANWGMIVKRYEITEVQPDEQISSAMDRQAAAERIRRERVLTAEGHKAAARLEAEGEAAAVLVKAQAQSDAIKLIADALKADSGRSAAEVSIADKYIRMYGEMAQKSNTMVFSERPADVRSLMAQAAAVFRNDPSEDNTKTT